MTVLVNNAGVGSKPGIGDCSDEEWDRVIAINQTGVFLGMRTVIPGMKRAGGGSIINIAPRSLTRAAAAGRSSRTSRARPPSWSSRGALP